jgi:hypothetical protein
MRGAVLLGLVMPLAAQQVRQGQIKLPGAITPHQALELWQRLGAREAFLDSAEFHGEPQSLYRFFERKDYAKLRGNPVLGYNCPGRFRWVGKRVAWHGISPVTPEAAPITARAWDEAFRIVARKRGWVQDPRAPIRVSGACVGAVLAPGPGQPRRGVCIEVKVASPTGTLLYRFSVAKPTLEVAVGAALDWVLCCAVALEPGAGEGRALGASQP